MAVADECMGFWWLGEVRPGDTPEYGTVVAPQVDAPNHQHFFNVRLDFDLDGPANSVQQVDVVPETLDDRNPFANAFFARPTVLRTEKQARANLKLESARTWKVVNPNVLNAVGAPVAY